MTHTEYVNKSSELIMQFIQLVELRYQSREEEMEAEILALKQRVTQLSAALERGIEAGTVRQYGTPATAPVSVIGAKQ